MEAEIREDGEAEAIEVAEDREKLVFERHGAEDSGPSGYVIFEAGSTGRRIFGPDWDGPFNFPVGMDNLGGRLEKAGGLLAKGWSAARAARAVGMAAHTAIKLRRVLELVSGDVLKCPCGREARHFGTCSYRLTLSTAQQEKLARLIRLHRERCAVKRIARDERKQKRKLTDAVRADRRWRVFLGRLDRRAKRLRQRTEREKLRYELFISKRAFTRPVEDESFDLKSLFQRVAAERSYEEILMRRNFSNAIPKAGESLLQMDMWLACARPKPSFGVFKRWLKEMVDAGSLTRIGGGNRRYYVKG